MTIETSKIGQVIRERRAELGWTQRQLALASGLDQSHVSRIEIDKAEPSPEQLTKLAAALKVTPAQLKGETSVPAPSVNGASAAPAPTPALAPALPRSTLYAQTNGARPLPCTRDVLGRLVRAAWVRWARQQQEPKAEWLLSYDEIGEDQREVDCQIGEAVARAVLQADAARASMLEEVSCDA
jgi:transcriptional regulator with XRE-family HTH domain